MRHFLVAVIGLTFLAMASGIAGSAKAAERLSPQEVREIFIGTPWHSDSGAFIFRTDGTYSYYNFDDREEWGTWIYRMTDRGALSGGSTNYTFFRRNNGRYIYYHSRSGNYYNAYPNKSYP